MQEKHDHEISEELATKMAEVNEESFSKVRDLVTGLKVVSRHEASLLDNDAGAAEGGDELLR